MGRSRYRITDPTAPYFLTCTVSNWLPVFTRQETVTIVLDSLRYLQNEGLSLHSYVILENHLHLIAASAQLETDIHRFKSYTARAIIDWLTAQRVKTLLKLLAFSKIRHKKDRRYQLWQEGVHPQLIQTREMMRQKLDYIHYNPVKRGYVDEAVHWRYSSARNYANLPALLEVDKAW